MPVIQYFRQKLWVLRLMLLQLCLVCLLSACELRTSCEMQAVAGGAQYCEESTSGK